MLTQTGRAFRDEAIARLTPDLEAIARAIPHDRVAAVLPLLAEILAHLSLTR
jgi:hypothetical protein